MARPVFRVGVQLLAFFALEAFASVAARADFSDLRGMAVIEGRCESLVVAGRPRRGCQGKLMNTKLKDGRTGFYFIAENTIITFSGLSQERVKSNGDEMVQPVDMLIANNVKDPAHPDKYRVAGSCRFGSRYDSRPERIRCQADTARGRFEGVFVTSGEAPWVSEWDPPQN